jgi:signal transduction histidine kinase
MIVASRIDGAAAFAVVERLISRSIVFSLIIVTVTFIAAILFSRSITRPLDTLVEGMTKVGHGHLDTQIQVKTRDEISTLAKSFNTMIRDLSQSRAELVKINSELESKVRDRTKKLEEQNQAVKQAQEALLRTTRLAAVGEIAGRAAHEVLNPLTSLMTRVQRVQRRLQEISSSDAAVVAEIVDSWQKDYEAGGYDKLLEVWRTRSEILEGKSIWDEDLKNIAELISKWNQEQNHIVEDTDFLLGEAERISRIVQGMRALSVVKGTKRKYHAHELLNNAKNIMADLFEQSGIEIRLALEAQSDLVDIDKDEFIQSITNIMRNSLQAISGVYESQTGGRLQLRTFDRDGYWYLDVIDNGVGIISSDQKKIFENNFSTKSPEEGTGLGLSISRRFIRAYGGDIAFVSSTPRKETIFRVSLPLHVTSVTEVAV